MSYKVINNGTKSSELQENQMLNINNCFTFEDFKNTLKMYYKKKRYVTILNQIVAFYLKNKLSLDNFSLIYLVLFSIKITIKKLRKALKSKKIIKIKNLYYTLVSFFKSYYEILLAQMEFQDQILFKMMINISPNLNIVQISSKFQQIFFPNLSNLTKSKTKLQKKLKQFFKKLIEIVFYTLVVCFSQQTYKYFENIFLNAQKLITNIPIAQFPKQNIQLQLFKYQIIQIPESKIQVKINYHFPCELCTDLYKNHKKWPFSKTNNWLHVFSQYVTLSLKFYEFQSYQIRQIVFQSIKLFKQLQKEKEYPKFMETIYAIKKELMNSIVVRSQLCSVITKYIPEYYQFFSQQSIKCFKDTKQYKKFCSLKAQQEDKSPIEFQIKQKRVGQSKIASQTQIIRGINTFANPYFQIQRLKSLYKILGIQKFKILDEKQNDEYSQKKLFKDLLKTKVQPKYQFSNNKVIIQTQQEKKSQHLNPTQNKIKNLENLRIKVQQYDLYQRKSLDLLKKKSKNNFFQIVGNNHIQFDPYLQENFDKVNKIQTSINFNNSIYSKKTNKQLKPLKLR